MYTSGTYYKPFGGCPYAIYYFKVTYFHYWRLLNTFNLRNLEEFSVKNPWKDLLLRLLMYLLLNLIFFYCASYKKIDMYGPPLYLYLYLFQSNPLCSFSLFGPITAKVMYITKTCICYFIGSAAIFSMYYHLFIFSLHLVVNTYT